MPMIQPDAPHLWEPVLGVTANEQAEAETMQPNMGQIFGAAFRQNNIIGSLAGAQDAGVTMDREPGFDAWSKIKGTKYESHWNSFADIFNSHDLALRQTQIDMEDHDKRTMAQGGWAGTIAGVIAGTADPSVLVPVVGGVAKARTALNIGRAALETGLSVGAGSAVQEAGLQVSQQTLTPQESAIAIGSSILLGGFLGGAAGMLAPAGRATATAALDRLRAPQGAPLGKAGDAGAAAAETATREGLTVEGKVAGAIVDSTDFLNPNLRLNTSPSVQARLIGQQTAENTIYQAMHGEGASLGPAVETFMREEMNGKLYAAKSAHDAIFADGAKAGFGMSRAEFEDAIGRAMRRNDTGENEFVSQAAKAWRDQVFEPFKKQAIEEGLLPADVSVETADSYFRRMWNVNRLNAEEQRFKQIGVDYFNGSLANEYKADVERLQGRIAKLEQEKADLALPAEQRTQTLKDLEAEQQQLYGNAPEHVDRADQLAELRQQQIDAKRAKNPTAAKTAQEAAAKLRTEGGTAFDAFVKKRADLNNRMRNVGLNYAGIAEKRDVIANSLADLAEATRRSMERLVKKGQAFERERQKLAPDVVAAKVSDLRESFAAEAAKAERQAEKFKAQAQKLEEQAQKEVPVAEPKQLFRAAPGDTSASVAELRAKMPLDKTEKKKLDNGYAYSDPELSTEALKKKALAPVERPMVVYRASGIQSNELFEKGVFTSTSTRESIHNLHNADEAAKRGARFAEIHVQPGTLGFVPDSGIEHEVVLGPSTRYTKIGEHTDSEGRVIEEYAAYSGTGKNSQGAQGAALLDAQAKAEAARAEHLTAIADRLEMAEALDPQAAIDEIRNGVDSLIAEASNTALARGEKAQRLQERMAKLDPKKVDDRLKSIEQMRKDYERGHYDKWEIQRGADLADEAAPDFSQYSKDIMDAVHDKLTGRGFDNNLPDNLVPVTRGPLKERTFHIPDLHVEDFLHDNIMHVAHDYARKMASEIELTRRFGSADMKGPLAKVQEEYKGLRQAVEGAASIDEIRAITGKDPGMLKGILEKVKEPTTENVKAKALAYLTKREKNDLEDLQAMRDLLRGTYKKANMNNIWGRTARGLLSFNYITRMGGVLLANASEVFRPAMVFGMKSYMSEGVAPLLTEAGRISFGKAVHEAQLAGQVVERWLRHRIATSAEMGDPYAHGNAMERLLDQGTRIASRWNGLTLWTDGMKAISSVLSQNRIIKALRSGEDDRMLAFLGMDASMRSRVSAMLEHAEKNEGIWVANTEKWTDEGAIRAYRAAMSKDVDSVIVTRSVGDVPLFANTPTGKLITQFKSFALASHQRVLIKGMQENPTRFMSGMVGMTAMGMLATYLRAVSTNRVDKLTQDNNPGWWISEGIDSTGILSVPMEFANTIEKATTVNPLKDPLRAAGAAATGGSMGPGTLRYQSRGKFGALLGPTVGMGDDLFSVLGALTAHATGRDVNPGTDKAGIDAGARMLPFYSYPGMRQLIDYGVKPGLHQAVGAN